MLSEFWSNFFLLLIHLPNTQNSFNTSLPRHKNRVKRGPPVHIIGTFRDRVRTLKQGAMFKKCESNFFFQLRIFSYIHMTGIITSVIISLETMK